MAAARRWRVLLDWSWCNGVIICYVWRCCVQDKRLGMSSREDSLVTTALFEVRAVGGVS